MKHQQKTYPFSHQGLSIRLIPRFMLCWILTIRYLNHVLLKPKPGTQEPSDSTETGSTQELSQDDYWDKDKSPKELRDKVIKTIEAVYPENDVKKKELGNKIRSLYAKSFGLKGRLGHIFKRKGPLLSFKEDVVTLYNKTVESRDAAIAEIIRNEKFRAQLSQFVSDEKRKLEHFVQQPYVNLNDADIKTATDALYQLLLKENRLNQLNQQFDQKTSQEVFSAVLVAAERIYDANIEELMNEFPNLEPPKLLIEVSSPSFYTNSLLREDNRHAFASGAKPPPPGFTAHPNVLPPGVEAIYDLTLGIDATQIAFYTQGEKIYEELLAAGHALHTKRDLMPESTTDFMAEPEATHPQPQNGHHNGTGPNASSLLYLFSTEEANDIQIVPTAEFGNWIRGVRTAKDMTVEALAHYCGVKKTTIQRWEDSRHMPKAENFYTVIRGLGYQLLVHASEPEPERNSLKYEE